MASRVRGRVDREGRADGGGEVKAVIYTRVSRDRSGTQRSCRQQEAECRRFVERQPDWMLHDRVYSDNDRSASRYATKPREEWEDLLIELERGRFGVLVVWEPSRATRDRRVWVVLMTICEEAGVKIAANGNVYDLSDPEQAFQLDLFFALAVRESGVTRKRVKRDMTASAEKGLPHGKLTYGYQRIYNERTRRFERQVPDDEPRTAKGSDGAVIEYTAAGIVRQMYRDLLAGVPLITIERRLNARGIPGPKPERRRSDDDEPGPSRWRRGAIRKMLLNEAYIGTRMHHDVATAEECWDALVDAETFYDAKSLLNDPERTTTRPARASHLLSFVARCQCGGPLQAARPGGNTTGNLRYRCMDRYCAAVSLADLDEFVVDRVMEWLADTDLLALLDADESSTDAAEARDEAARLRAKLEDERRQLDDPFADVPPSFYRREKALMAAIAEAEERGRRRLPAVLRQFAGQDPVAVWDGIDLPARRDFLKRVADIRLHPAGKGRRHVPMEERITLTWLLGEDADE